MPTKLDRIVYGLNKDINFSKYDFGKVVKSVAYDLEEFETKGVQGLAVQEGDARRIVEYCKKAGLKEPYIQAGTVNKKDLVLVVCDKQNKTFEQMAVLVRNYETTRSKLKKNTVAVVNLQPGDQVIDGAVDALEDRFKVNATDEDNADFGKITGNIVLSAHGTPENLKNGKIIGSQLAGKSPDQIVQLLIDKGMGKAYDGRVDLSGCFTASGGPAAAEKDTTFAEKVLKLLRKKGYKKVTIEAWPGPMYTNKMENFTDSVGTNQKRGQEGVWPNQQDEKGSDIQEKVNQLNADCQEYAKQFQNISNSMAPNRPTTDPAQAQWDLKNDQLKGINKKWKKAIKELGVLNQSEAMKTFANYKGVFGLRKID